MMEKFVNDYEYVEGTGDLYSDVKVVTPDFFGRHLRVFHNRGMSVYSALLCRHAFCRFCTERATSYTDMAEQLGADQKAIG